VGVGSGTEWAPAWDWLLRRLNEQRDTLVQVVPGGVMLAGPCGLLPVARAAAPDLWNYQSIVIDGPAAALPSPAGDLVLTPPVPNGDEQAFAEWALQEPVRPSPDVLPALQEVAAKLQAGRGDDAARLAAGALDRAKSPDDAALAEASLARALALKGDAVGSIGHAEHALSLGRPLGQATGVAPRHRCQLR
jgi:hypothetical protein